MMLMPAIQYNTTFKMMKKDVKCSSWSSSGHISLHQKSATRLTLIVIIVLVVIINFFDTHNIHVIFLVQSLLI